MIFTELKLYINQTNIKNIWLFSIISKVKFSGNPITYNYYR